MAVIPFDVGENVVDLVTDRVTTIIGLCYHNGRIDKENCEYDNCVTIYISEGIRTHQEVRKLDECEREYIEYASNIRRAV